MALNIVVLCLAALLNILFIKYQPAVDDEKVTVNFTVCADQGIAYELYYMEKGRTLESGFQPENKGTVEYNIINTDKILSYSIPADTGYVRLDFGAGESKTYISKIEVAYRGHSKELSLQQMEQLATKQETVVDLKENSMEIISQFEDPYIVWDTSEWGVKDLINDARSLFVIIIKILACFSIDIICLGILKYAKQVVALPVELYHNRKLVFNLAKNDFKTKFAGSYLGIVWAFVQPIITVLVYWFVFEKGLKAGGINMKAGITVPYVLWLVAGLVPWFFFQDALNGATNALIEYSYLVKKVVFKISILPIVKIISAIFVHLFFVGFTIVLYAGYKYYPDIYMLQMLYYSLCMLILILGLSYMTSAIVIFFRDLTQVINIVLQVGIWVTPIMWNIDTMELSPFLVMIFKINPMYYIVLGYRDALITKVWFWEHPELTAYFWIVTIFTFGVGSTIFKRLKVHFADVL